MTYSKIPFVKDKNYAQISGLCAFCRIMWKIASYVQNYASAA